MIYNPQLDTFLQVAALGSFSKAAEAMFITAPAVIKQINLLEESLGVKLFVRTHRGAAPDRGGQVHVRRCQTHHPGLQRGGGAGQECHAEQ